MISKTILLIPIIFYFISCAVNPYVLTPEYKNRIIKNKELLIVEIDSSIFSIDSSVFSDKNSAKEYLFAFQKGFENGIAEVSSFSRIWTNAVNMPEIIKAQEVILPTGDKIKLFFPKTEKIITDKDGHIPDYLLIISKLELESAWVEERFGPYKEWYSQTVHYVIWDNYYNKLVCYGKSVESSQFFSPRFDSITISFFIKQNVRFIIANSPFIM